MHHNIRTQRKRLLQHGRGKCIVHHQQGAVLMGNLCAGCNVRNFQHRVGWRLQPDQPRIGPDCGTQFVRILDLRESEAEICRPFTNIVKQPETTTVKVITGNHVIPCIQQLKNGGSSRHPGGESQAADSALQVGDAFFVSIPCRIVAAGILPALVVTRAFLHVRAGRINRRHNRPG